MSETLLLAAVALAATSGVPGLFLRRTAKAGEWLAALFMLGGAALGCAAAITALTTDSPGITYAWHVPGGEFALRVDALSAMFILQIFVLALLGSIYGLGYWRQAEHPSNGRKLRLFYGLLTGAMALLVSASNTMLFIAAWEVMTLTAFLTLTTEDERASVREVGYVYIVSTRLGTLCLFALFALLFTTSGGFAFAAPALGTSPTLSTAIFLLGVAGFGLKAGVMPMHVWLPGAHANAPSHVSALMSGVLIKTGIYGLVRLCSLFANPPVWWGSLILGLGIVSGVFGVAFAIGQHDLKRLLAYHSVENIGIICIGLGVALLGRSLGRGELVVLGLGGALLHVWNHGLFKGLLFLAAGSVLHATGTRELDQLGGIAKRMPWTTLAFLTGAVAICGLPPLNGFVSELLVYLGLFRAAGSQARELWLAGALAAPALALIGALAGACFAKAFGTVFLGEGRSAHAARAHEASVLMLAPMAVLAGACVVIGLAPPLVAPILQAAVDAWAPEAGLAQPALHTLAPFGYVSLAGLALLGALGTVALWQWVKTRGAAGGRQSMVGTWDCGYAAPSARMQYTASSFAQALIGLFAWGLRPRIHAPKLSSLFPKPATFESHVPDLILDRLLVPSVRFATRATHAVRFMQGGNLHAYVLYVLLTVLVLLWWR